MAFTPEDGTGLTTSNAYCDEAFADAYFSDRGNTVWSSATTAAKEAAIVRASDFLDRNFIFIGCRFSSEQALEWPREHAYDSLGSEITGVPTGVQKACAEYALRELSARIQPDPLYDERGLQVRRTLDIVGSLETEVEYANFAQNPDINRKYPSADRWLRGLIVPKGTSIMKG